ncbi:MAG TPA: hypothetical protein VK907_14495, partial [Phnomibacter sp.]|nr:hypothetical protein [Phnomibacter sp.]
SDAYNCRGGQKTSVDGRYAFSTIIPVPYKADADNEASWRPAHIHMRVSVPGQQDLVTQIYFKGGKYVDSDPWASTPQAVNRVLPVSSDASGASVVVFDVVLAKEMTLEPKVYERICGIYDMGGGITAEFFRNDDHLMMKRNGQLVASLSYKGNNTFQEGDLYTKARFDLLPDGGTRVTIGDEGKARSGVRYLKYPDR